MLHQQKNEGVYSLHELLITGIGERAACYAISIIHAADDYRAIIVQAAIIIIFKNIIFIAYANAAVST
jgi:hypothetical protein